MAIKFFKATFFQLLPAIVPILKKKDYQVEVVEGSFNINEKHGVTPVPFTEVFVEKSSGPGSIAKNAFLTRNKFFPF